MGIYHSIYHNLCTRGVKQKSIWEQSNSGYHCHHVLPKHMGGTDDESNLTYLTIREHIIAHYLLWKLHRLPNDLRAMHMLGAKLTTAQRRVVGIWCRDTGIGFYAEKWKSFRAEWTRKGIKTQKDQKIGIFDPINFSANASIGGKASIRSDKNPWKYWASSEGRKERAKMGALAHIGKKWIYQNGKNTRCKPEDLQKMLDSGWKLGFRKSASS